jgi:predicted small secreted protein
MKKKSIFVVLPISMLLISVVLTSCAQTAASGAPKIITSANTQGWSIPPASYTPLQVGGLAPDFAEVDVLTGKFVTIKQFAGKTVLLNFVNYGCSSAVNNAVSAQLLAIQKLAQTRSDFVPVSVFCGCCPKETLKQFA